MPSRTRLILLLGVMVALGPLTIDMYLPALPNIADDLRGVIVGRATHAHRDPGRSGPGSADRRPAVGLAGPSTAAHGGHRAAHGGVGAVPVRAEYRTPWRGPRPAGNGGGRSDGRGFRRRGRSVRGVGRRDRHIPLDARSWRRTGARPVAWRRSPVEGVLALGVRGAGGDGRGSAVARRDGAAGNASDIASTTAEGAQHRGHLCRGTARCPLRRARPCRRARHVRPVRLHLGCGVRAAGPVSAWTSRPSRWCSVPVPSR